MIKNYILRTAAMFTLLCGAVAVSCSNDDNGGKEPGPGPGPDPSNPIAATYSRCEYKGDFAGKGTDFFNLIITTGQVNASGEATGEGYIFNLNLNSLASGAAKPIPANGTYNFDAANSFAANTISSNLSKATGYDKALKATTYSFSAAQVIVTKDGENFKVTGEITLNTNTKIAFTATVTNWVDLSEGGGGEEGELAENVDLKANYSGVGYMGTYINNQTEELFSIYTLVFYEKENGGPAIQVMITAPNAEYFRNAVLPEGTFEIVDELRVGIAMPGYTDENNNFMGLWYINEDTNVFGSGVSGNVTISKSGANHTVTVNAKTANDYSIKTSFTGAYTKLQDLSGTVSTLKKDSTIDFTGVTSADAYYYGDADNLGTGRWSLIIGTKQGFIMDYFTANPEQTTLPTGTFTPAWSGEAQTCLPGGLDEQEDGVYVIGSFYFTRNATNLIDNIGPVNKGSIVVTPSGANFKFDIDFTDDNGYKVTGTWTGPVTVKDGNASKSPAKSMAKGNYGFKALSSTMFMTSKPAAAASEISIKKANVNVAASKSFGGFTKQK